MATLKWNGLDTKYAAGTNETHLKMLMDEGITSLKKTSPQAFWQSPTDVAINVSYLQRIPWAAA